MLVACTSNRLRELRDEGSSAGCALKPTLTTRDTHLRQPQHELRLPSHTNISSNTFTPTYLPTYPPYSIHPTLPLPSTFLPSHVATPLYD